MTRTEQTNTVRDQVPASLPPFARWPVFGLAGGLAVLLLITASRYGYIGDELYFRVIGGHLDWSFPDQPPLVPLLAGAMDSAFPGSILALRLPAILCTAAGVVVCALLARELGGSTKAQVLAAGAFLCSPFMVLFGRYLLTSTLDVTLSAVLTLLLVRWLRTRADRLLLFAALVCAVALQAKMMIVIVTAALIVALAVCGPRALLTRRPLWIGAGIAALTAVPMLVWQAGHGWPQLRMGDVLDGAAEDKAFGSGPLGFFLDAAMMCGVAGTLLLGYGLVRIFRDRERRFLAVAFGLLVALFAVLGWSGYYIAALFPVLWAAGAVGLEGVRERWASMVVWLTLVVSLVIQVVNLPVRPLADVVDSDFRFDVSATAGWPELVADVAEDYQLLPARTRERTAIVSGTYELASAIDRYGPDHDLPRTYSPYLGLWYVATPPESAETVLHIGDPSPTLRAAFGSAEQVGSTDNGLGVENSFQGLPVWVLSDRKTSWSQLWPQLRVP
ncbi:ArnT family glycosyltransferase [Amycolatopsis antarctica]|nr:glycosyltransferase family 39 protein [Amycolatopsis antarctica]